MRQRGVAGPTTVEQLLSSKTFLGGLSDVERAGILGPEPCHSSPLLHTGASRAARHPARHPARYWLWC